MSWQLASFLIVGATLAGAFWWYERSQPSAKLLAVIGTLAALAALGRDAFAAIPDVKPITTIVLVSGIAFGAGPGFAIGAISGLASNVLLGQGPWTPWQMLGWGLVAVFGALLGALGGRRLPTWALALACAVGAELFNLVLDLYTWTGTGNHSLRGFGAVLGSALVFDVTHVLASFAFGLAFGSVLLRMLVRVQGRLQVRWAGDEVAAHVKPTPKRSASPALAGICATAVLALGLLAFALAQREDGARATPAAKRTPVALTARVAIGREVAYLEAAQNPDGGFGGAQGQTSSELYSAWVAIGLAAAGRDPLSLRREGHTPLDVLRGQAASIRGAGDLERTILALYACGVSVRSLPGGDPVAKLLRGQTADGSFGHLSNLTAFGVFALRAAGYRAASPRVRRAAAWLARQQDADGGFGFGARGGISDVDDTGAVLQALRDAGVSRGRARAVSYLRRAQNLDGGFGQERGASSNAQSTAWAVQGLIAAGQPVAFVRRGGSRSPLGYLEALVAPDGSVRYSATGAQTPVWVTAQALTALAGRTFPIAAPGR
jgi:prenyltransferase beta subunit